MSNLPSSEFRTYTDTELRERITRFRGVHDPATKVLVFRILRELAVRKSLRSEGKHVLIQAKI